MKGSIYLAFIDKKQIINQSVNMLN